MNSFELRALFNKMLNHEAHDLRLRMERKHGIKIAITDVDAQARITKGTGLTLDSSSKTYEVNWQAGELLGKTTTLPEEPVHVKMVVVSNGPLTEGEPFIPVRFEVRKGDETSTYLVLRELEGKCWKIWSDALFQITMELCNLDPEKTTDSRVHGMSGMRLIDVRESAANEVMRREIKRIADMGNALPRSVVTKRLLDIAHKVSPALCDVIYGEQDALIYEPETATYQFKDGISLTPFQIQELEGHVVTGSIVDIREHYDHQGVVDLLHYEVKNTVRALLDEEGLDPFLLEA